MSGTRQRHTASVAGSATGRLEQVQEVYRGYLIVLDLVDRSTWRATIEQHGGLVHVGVWPNAMKLARRVINEHLVVGDVVRYVAEHQRDVPWGDGVICPSVSSQTVIGDLQAAYPQYSALMIRDGIKRACAGGLLDGCNSSGYKPGAAYVAPAVAATA